MNPTIIHSNNPYVMDYLDAKKPMPALTRKNADFTEAIVGLDSNYAKDSKPIPPDDTFDPEVNASNADKKFCGTTAYWFSEMTKSDFDFHKCLLGAIISIDTTNSTHLEAAENGRKEMRDRIVRHYHDLSGLKSTLSKPYNGEADHPLAVLTDGIKAKGKDGIRYNISFASKFCSYACAYLDLGNSYSKYDNVVSDALPEYVKAYLGRKVDKREYKVRQNVKNRYEHILEVYKKYAAAIEEILSVLGDDNRMTKDEFDHIVWYGYKGKQH